jgi:hypothetical protein
MEGVKLKFVSVLLSLCLLSGLVKAEDHIGSVSEPFYQGAIGILPQSSGTEALNYSIHVYPREIVDASTGRTSLSFNDGTVLQVGVGSKVKLDEFIFDPKSGTLSGVLNFGAGVFRYASGTLAKHNNLKLNTPVASMSVRGTKLVIRVDEDGETRVDVLDGAIGLIPCPVKNAALSGVPVKEGQTATVDVGCRVSVIGASENPQHELTPRTPEQSTAALSSPSPPGPAGGGPSDPPGPTGGGPSGPPGSTGGDPPGPPGPPADGTKPGNGFGDKNHTHSGPPGQSGSHGNNGRGHGKS